MAGNNIADRIMKVSKKSLKKDSETNEEEILREKYIPPDLRHKFIGDSGLKAENYWWFEISIIV